uniref:DUF19 domain-containing protein n=1 Tax=Anisakis simplex TaxID=6269 RepID=A0A0M3IY75_ANISI
LCSFQQTEGVVITLNPIIKTDKTDLQKMCAMYRHALRCIGPVAYTECRKSHPILAEIDAIYGYVCGTKQRIFETHLDCIQKLHIESYRLAVCEDSTHRAMRFIDASASDVVEKQVISHLVPRVLLQKQKCEALNWMMRCEKSTILKRCSLEASIVNDESLISASQYISPGKTLELDVRSHEKETSIAYQVAYGYKKHELRRLCADYNNALKNTKSVVKRNCIRRFATYNIVRNEINDSSQIYTSNYLNIVFMHSAYALAFLAEERTAYVGPSKQRDHSFNPILHLQVYFQLNYPCGHGTSENFFRHFNCLSKVRQDEKIVKCEKNAARALDDPSNEPCDAYSILSECMYDTVVNKCGYDAWEIDYQYLSHLVGNTVPNCRMKRIVRNDHSKPTRAA